MAKSPAGKGSPPRQPRVGIVASRRIGNAVQRSRARRMLREAYRLNQQRLKQNIELVLVARAAIHGLGLREVQASIGGLFEAAGVIGT